MVACMTPSEPDTTIVEGDLAASLQLGALGAKRL